MIKHVQNRAVDDVEAFAQIIQYECEVLRDRGGVLSVMVVRGAAAPMKYSLMFARGASDTLCGPIASKPRTPSRGGARPSTEGKRPNIWDTEQRGKRDDPTK